MTTRASSTAEPAATPAPPDAARARAMARRMISFVLIVATILLGTNAFVCATWSHFLGMPGWLVWQMIPALFPVAFIGATIIGFRYANPLLQMVYAISAAWLGALNFAFFAAMACWIAAGMVNLTGLAVSRFDMGAAFFGVAILVAAYGIINAAWLRVTRITVALPNLPEAWVDRTIALVTDVHLGHVSGPRFLRRIISQLRSVQPDVVLISGDMFDGTTVDLDRLVAPWSRYSAPRGIYYVTGNHDEFAERSIYTNAMAKTGVRVLNNEKVTLDGLQIVGVHDSEAGEPDELRAILQRARLDPASPSILLAHQPSNLRVAEEEGISLQLSGHTHRGQMWPWNLLVSRIYGPFAYGLHRLGKLLVYTSSGAGTWGPPVRVGTKSEIVLIRLSR